MSVRCCETIECLDLKVGDIGDVVFINRHVLLNVKVLTFEQINLIV